jgi:DNA-binding Lrp family transcriptional regulator
MTHKIDIIDKKILNYLDINARITLPELSKKIRKPKETIYYRIQNMQKSNIVKKFYAIINASPLGYNYYLIFIKFEKINEKKHKEIKKFIMNTNCCINIRNIEGYYDLYFTCVFRSLDEFNEFILLFYSEFSAWIIEKSVNIILGTHKYNQKALFDSPTKRIYIDHSIIGTDKIDKTEIEIMKEICENSRIKITDLSRKIKKSWTIAKYHLRKLERKKIMIGYFTYINFEILGRNLLLINICLKDPKCRKSIAEFFDKTNTCLFAYDLIGKYDLSVELFPKDEAQIRKIIDDFKKVYYRKYTYFDIFRSYGDYMINWCPF